MEDFDARQCMEDHIKALVNGLDYDYVAQMQSLESADAVTVSIEFSDPKGLGSFLGGEIEWE